MGGCLSSALVLFSSLGSFKSAALPPCTIHLHLTSSSKSCNYALNLLFLHENDKFSSASLLFASQVAMAGVSEVGDKSRC